MNPRVHIRWREGEPPYVEVWNEADGGMIIHGWVHDDPYPCYEMAEEDEEEYEDDDEEEEEESRPDAVPVTVEDFGRIILTQEEIIDPPLFRATTP